jgi:hypothetical protein
MENSNEIPTRFITAEQVVKNALINIDENSPHLYAKMFHYVTLGLRELEYDVIDSLKQTYLAVDATTQTAVLPDDYLQYVRVGVITTNNEIQDLAYNDNMVVGAIAQPECHCECGCTDQLCYALGESNLNTTTTDVVINGVTYQKTVTICANEDGSIVQKTCQPTITNPKQKCNYTFTIDYASLDYPLSNCYFTINGQEKFIGDIADSSTFLSVFTAEGFAHSSIIFTKNNSTDVYTTFNYTDEAGNTGATECEQSACSIPTPIVETVCYTEKICDATVAECGCVTITDTVINVIQQWSTLFTEFIQRDLNALDWQKALKSPLSWFGYFNISKQKNLIQLDYTYPFDNVFLQYVSASKVDSSKYLIPIFAEQALTQYCKWMYKESKNNISMGEKERERRSFYNEKKKLHQRNHAFNIANYLDSKRNIVRP